MEENNITSDSTARTVDSTHHHSVADLLATILSWVLVPTLIPVYSIFLILWLSPLSLVTSVSMRLYVAMIIFGITCVLPAIIIYVFKLLGFVSEVGLNRRRERTLPYCVVILSYLLSAWYLYYLGAPDWVTMFYVGGGVAAFINLIINFRWKISAHSAAMGGVCVVLLHIAHLMPGTVTLVWMCVWLLLTGLLGTARVWLRRHTLLQVLAGCAVGAASVYFMTLIHY